MNNEMREMYDILTKNISNNNISGARARFDTIFLFFNKEIDFIDQCINECDKLDGFYDDFDNEKLILNPNEWTQEYYNDLQSSIPGNYCKERIYLLISINKYLMTGKIPEIDYSIFETVEDNSDSEEEKYAKAMEMDSYNIEKEMVYADLGEEEKYDEYMEINSYNIEKEMAYATLGEDETNDSDSEEEKYAEDMEAKAKIDNSNIEKEIAFTSVEDKTDYSDSEEEKYTEDMETKAKIDNADLEAKINKPDFLNEILELANLYKVRHDFLIDLFNSDLKDATVRSFFKKFDNIKGFFQEQNWKILYRMPKSWTKEYMEELNKDLQENFSKDRILLLVDIVNNFKSSEEKIDDLDNSEDQVLCDDNRDMISKSLTEQRYADIRENVEDIYDNDDNDNTSINKILLKAKEGIYNFANKKEKGSSEFGVYFYKQRGRNKEKVNLTKIKRILQSSNNREVVSKYIDLKTIYSLIDDEPYKAILIMKDNFNNIIEMLVTKCCDSKSVKKYFSKGIDILVNSISPQLKKDLGEMNIMFGLTPFSRTITNEDAKKIFEKLVTIILKIDKELNI